MSMPKKRKIPKFKSIKEEAKFWDRHDITDYLSDMKRVEVVFKPAIQKKETLTIRVQSNLKKKLQNIAADYGLSTSTLTRMWLMDKLQDLDSNISRSR